AEYEMDAVIDRFQVRRDLHKTLRTAVETALRLGEGFLRIRIDERRTTNDERETTDPPFSSAVGRSSFVVGQASGGIGCPEHHITMGELLPFYFSFNELDSACPTCLGLGTYLKVHPDLLVPDRSRSIQGGAFIPEAFRYDRNTWSGRMMYSL